MKPRETQKKGRRQPRSRDTAYRRDQERSSASKKRSHPMKDTSGLLAMRADTSVYGDDGQPLKTSILIREGVITATADQVFRGNLLDNLSAIPSHRPLADVVAYSDAGSPLQMITPINNTTLSRVAKYGPVSVFSNAPPKPLLSRTSSELRIEDEFFHSIPYQAMKEVLSTIKFQQINVTPELLTATRKESSKRGKHRSQQRVMVKENVSEKLGSATQYALATQLFSTSMKWEWLHLLANAILGYQSQIPENLVTGSMHANTGMLFIECDIAHLSQAYPEGFMLQVTAELIEGTHIAKQIEYRIVTPDFTLPLIFDAQVEQQPHISHRDYICAIVRALVSAHKDREAMISSRGALSSSKVSGSQQALFYQQMIPASSDENDVATASHAPVKKPT